MKNKIEELPIEVKPLEGYLLYIKFKNNEEKIYDMKILCEIKTGWFASKHQQFLNVCFACL